MARQITQQMFDTIVLENIEEFDMSPDEAVKEAVQEFEAQGVNLDFIIKVYQPKNEDGKVVHAAERSVEKLRTALEQNPCDPASISAACAALLSTCGVSRADRCHATKSGAYDLLLRGLDMVDAIGEASCLLVLLTTLRGLIDGQPDILDDRGATRLVEMIQTPSVQTDILACLLTIVRLSCILHESNRQRFVTLGIILATTDVLLLNRAHRDVVRAACTMFSALTICVPYGKGHEHANSIVVDGNGVGLLLDLATGYVEDSEVLSEVFRVIGRLVVCDKFCMEVMNVGGVDKMLFVLKAHMKNESLVCNLLLIMKTLSGSDIVKPEIVRANGIALIIEAVRSHQYNAGVCEAGCSALAAIVVANGPEVICTTLELHSSSASVQFGCSELRDDLVKVVNPMQALTVDLLANVHFKVIQCFAENSQFRKLKVYVMKVGYSPDYVFLLRNVMRVSPEKGVKLLRFMVTDNDIILDINRIVDIFMSFNMIHPCTTFLLDLLKNNRPEESLLQTRLLGMNIMQAPQVADTIMQSRMLTHYDRGFVAQLCEKAGLVQRALENYTDLQDIKRIVVVHTHLLNPEWLVNYFGSLTAEDSLECIKAMLQTNNRHTRQVCIQIATNYHEKLTAKTLIQIFESLRIYKGLFQFLGSIINDSQDALVHFKYIQVACKTGRMQEVQRVCRESNFYNAIRVKNFLMKAKLSDQMPLLIVCDRFNYITDLVSHLYSHCLQKHIETYLLQVNPSRLPVVIGQLLDLGCAVDAIERLIFAVKGQFSTDELIVEAERRDRLNLLLPWLETCVQEGSVEPATHNALAKIHIDSNNNPERFLSENKYYDSHVVGKYCEKRDPRLAFIVYERGDCDTEIMDMLTNTLQDFNNTDSGTHSEVMRDVEPAEWSNLGRTLMARGKVAQAIDCYTNGRDLSEYAKIMDITRSSGLYYEELTKFLAMARSQTEIIESDFLFALAKDRRFTELDIHCKPNVTVMNEVADKCFAYKLYEAAKVLYSNTLNYAGLAITLVNLAEYEAATDAALKAGDIDTWKKVCNICVQDRQLKLANVCACQIMLISPDDIRWLFNCYMANNYTKEMFEVLEAAIELEGAHEGIFTEVVILYSVHKKHKVKKFLKSFWSHLNIPKVLYAVEQANLWSDLVFLYQRTDDCDNAIITMINHATDAWRHNLFKDLIVKVLKTEIFYKALQFYADNHPQLLNDLLIQLKQRLDHARAVGMLTKAKCIQQIVPYLRAVQFNNIQEVNEALNNVLIEDEDFEGLHASVEFYHNFDKITLAKQLEKHKMVEFRQIGLGLCKINDCNEVPELNNNKPLEVTHSVSNSVSLNDLMWLPAYSAPVTPSTIRAGSYTFKLVSLDTASGNESVTAATSINFKDEIKSSSSHELIIDTQSDSTTMSTLSATASRVATATATVSTTASRVATATATVSATASRVATATVTVSATASSVGKTMSSAAHVEKRQHCEHCDKRFVCKNALLIHMRTHSGDKPFTCIKCDKQFRTVEQHNRHMLMHTGKRRFSCPICLKKFSRQDNCKIHIPKHTLSVDTKLLPAYVKLYHC